MIKVDDQARGGRLEELQEAECLDLMRGTTVGRIGFAGPRGPLILPVNYVVDHGDIVFRTAAYNTMAALLNHAMVAFEVDEVDEFLQGGWSVLVQGESAYDDEADSLLQSSFTRPEPWVEGSRPLYIRIKPNLITGRRIHPL